MFFLFFFFLGDFGVIGEFRVIGKFRIVGVIGKFREISFIIWQRRHFAALLYHLAFSEATLRAITRSLLC